MADSQVRGKRPSVPQGDTPGKPQPKVRARSESEARRKCLFGKGGGDTSEQSSWSRWTTAEEAALVQYICLFWEDAHTNKWPTLKSPGFWNGCAEAVMNVCKTSRTGASCRTRVCKHLSKQFATLSEAEDMLQIDYFADVHSKASERIHHSTPNRCTGTDVEEILLSPVFNNSPHKKSETSTTGDLVKDFVFAFQNAMSLPPSQVPCHYHYHKSLVNQETTIHQALF